MRITTVASLFFVLVSFNGLAQKVFFFPQIADGGIIRTSFIFVNTGTSSDLTMEFFGSGEETGPMSLTVSVDGQEMTGASVELTLGSGEGKVVETTGAAGDQSPNGLLVGYARVTAGDGVGGTAVFSIFDESGNPVTEAGVPASEPQTSFSFFVDTIGSRDTGLAMVLPPAGGGAPAQEGANLTMTLFDTGFQQMGTTPIPLGLGQHISQFVAQYLSDNVSSEDDIQGVATIESDQPVAAVTLRQTGLVLTTFPVIPGVAEAASSGSFSQLPSGEIQVAMDTTAESRTVVGAIYRIYHGESGVEQITRGISAPGELSQLLPALPDKIAPSRVEARLVYAGGILSTGFELTP